MSGYAFHPDAFTDIDRLWEYVAEHNIDAADRIIADIVDAVRTLVASPHIRNPCLSNGLSRPAVPSRQGVPPRPAFARRASTFAFRYGGQVGGQASGVRPVRFR